MAALLATAFVVGLAGGVHCVAMCGGIVAALNLRAPLPIAAAGRGTARGFGRQLTYSLGRIATYAGAGALVGAAGGLGLLYDDVLPVQILLLIAANALIIFLGFHLAGIGTVVQALERTGSLLWRGLARLGARLAPAETGARAVVVGLLWGCLPCGLVYSVLATALVAGSAWRGAAVMAAFGLGTLPNLLAAGLAADRLRNFVGNPRARRLAGIAVILLGVVGLARIPGVAEHVKHGLHSLH